MSRYLGPIHHWLYRKIKTFEDLEDSIVEWGKNTTLPIDKYSIEAAEKFGPATDDLPLEELIDTDNIHGWLQDKITRAELRHGYLVTEIVKQNESLLEDLKKLYYEKGKALGKSLGNTGEPINTPKELFDLLHDYLLEGMPCDRVTEVIDTSESHVQWISHECLHRKYWDEVGGDVRFFYGLRDQWIGGFVKGYDSGNRFVRLNDKEQKIVREEEK